MNGKVSLAVKQCGGRTQEAVSDWRWQFLSIVVSISSNKELRHDLHRQIKTGKWPLGKHEILSGSSGLYMYLVTT